MIHPELQHEIPRQIETKETDAGYEITGKNYSLCFRSDKPYIDLKDTQGETWAQLFRGSDVNLRGQESASYDYGMPHYEHMADGNVKVTTWSRGIGDRVTEQVWLCREDSVETTVTVEGVRGVVDDVRFFGGVYVRPNMFGDSMSQHMFGSVFNPQASEMERRAIPATETTEITTSGMWQPGRRREFLISPFCYGFHRSEPSPGSELPDGAWLMAGISAPIAEQAFTRFTYDAHEDGFSLDLRYDGYSIEDGRFRSPTLLLHFADSPLRGLSAYRQHAQRLGHLSSSNVRESPAFIRGSTFCSWGHQLELARYHDGPPADLANETVVRDALDLAKDHGVHFDKFVIDDKWQAEYGTNAPDLDKWPDMRAFNLEQRTLGHHALLWWKLFDAEGLPPELCILDACGRPIASDPSNPDYLELVREQARYMVSDDGLAASGFKLDFLAQLPYGPGLRWHGKTRGFAALHGLMRHIHDATKQAKNETMIQAQVVSPWFSETFDQVRENDTNDQRPVIPAMAYRAALSAALMPDHPTDPDGWPMPDLETWLDYVKVQPKLNGTVTTHFVSSVGGVPLDETHYNALRHAIRQIAG